MNWQALFSELLIFVTVFVLLYLNGHSGLRKTKSKKGQIKVACVGQYYLWIRYQ